MEIIQGAQCAVTAELPFDPTGLTACSLDFFQQGQRVLSYNKAALTLTDHSASIVIPKESTMKFTPARVAVCFRGDRADGSTVQTEDLVATIVRSEYKAVSS